MKPKFPSRLLKPALVACVSLSSSALAADNFWTGSSDNDWNNPANWSLARVPVKLVEFDNAIVNTLTNFPVITASLAATPADIKIGTGSGNTGRVDHDAGSASAGDGNWSVIGEFGGNGTFNLADTMGTGGTLTGFGTGSGDFTTQRLYVSREGTGDMSVNTSGFVKVFNDMYVGEGGTGTLKWDAGTLDRNGDGGWMVIGKDGGGNDGNGTFDISGGTINAANDTIVGLDPGSVGSLNLTGGTYNAGGIWAGRGGGTGAWTVSGANTQLTSTGEVSIGRETGSNGNMQISSGTVAVNNWFNVGRDGGAGTLEMSGGALTVQRELRIGFGTGGSGTMNVSGGAQITAGTVSEHIVIGGDKGNGTATVSGTGTLVTSTNEFRVGNDDDSVGELTVTGGTVESGSWFGIGRNGSTGTLTISGTGVVNQGVTDLVSRLEMTNNNKPTSATINLDGGTLSTNGIISGSNGTRNIFLNGGVLQARVDNLNFLEGMSNVTVKSGGAKIDTNGVSVTINQSMNGQGVDGGLIKFGLGTMRLNGTNTYIGTTTVNAGTIAGSGSLAGPLVVGVDATIAPGGPSSGIGTFSAGNTTIAGLYVCGVNGASSDAINVAGTLDLSSATDEIDFAIPGAGATQPVYIIANYTTLLGTFDTVTDLPSGYTLTHSLNGGNQIAITRPLTPYENWLATYFPGETNPAIIGTNADPDADGQSNKIEFALGGKPNDGANNAKIYHFTADSSDSGSQPELLMTIAVLSSTPAFTGTPSPTATFGGVTYTIDGSLDLSSFSNAVSVVSPVTSLLPMAPDGYEYRTFSLDGSNGLPSRGFMRVAISP